MRKWEDIPDDEILNYNDANTGLMSQYDRIMNHKLRNSIESLRTRIVEETRDLNTSINTFNKTSSRLSSILCWLNVILGFLTLILVYIGFTTIK